MAVVATELTAKHSGASSPCFGGSRDHKQRWLNFYMLQGYSERESVILAQQISLNGTGHGNPKIVDDRSRPSVRKQHNSQKDDDNYYLFPASLSFRDVLAAMIDALNRH
jgi:hypothetical protein